MRVQNSRRAARTALCGDAVRQLGEIDHPELIRGDGQRRDEQSVLGQKVQHSTTGGIVDVGAHGADLALADRDLGAESTE
ncbi:hypothetical protein [Rhodococcus erythropolis]|uniref:hypothetical protein n=1 Tax=Rhodococcus erythropolis TaxID=1833 RepID=UPI000878622A|nr:hypothetical protein [Rhodococcus erythropolis]OFV76444.1 hypothetical protein RERY_29690 [Rhodococcus erythropolis]